MFIDSHCHLNFRDYSVDLPAVLKRADHAGVMRYIVPGVEYLTSVSAVELSNLYPHIIYATVGFHPYEAGNEPDVTALEPLLPYNVVGIGECGLDYHRYQGEHALGNKDKQKRLFEAHLHIALKHDLPVIIHCREAFEDLFSILDTLPTPIKGVVHCFSGGIQDVKEIQKRNLYIGIDGNSTYSKKLQSIIPSLPLSLLLLETDSPNLTPVPFRGKRNEPSRIPLIAHQIATLMHSSIDIVEQTTTQNVESLFHLS